MYFRRFSAIFTICRKKTCKNLTTNPNAWRKHYNGDKFWDDATFSRTNIFLITTVGYLTLKLLDENKHVYARTRKKHAEVIPDVSIPNRTDLPCYKLAEIAKHTTKKDRIWVTYQHGVYDVTDYLTKHPGGDTNILKEAGRSLDPVFRVWKMHYSQHVLNLLEKYRIGNICHEDLEQSKQYPEPPDLYADEPPRSCNQVPLSFKPFNSGPTPKLLIDNFVTPSESCYIRNHLPVPNVSPDEWQVEVSIKGKEGGPLNLSFKDLKSMPMRRVMVTTQCAGNRRDEMMKERPIKALLMKETMISNSIWTGVPLRDILLKAGLTDDDAAKYKHVIFEGYDNYQGDHFEMSIALHKAMDPRCDVIICYERNGKELGRDHGMPVRALVPGHAANKNVKWLRKIYVTDHESQKYFQQRLYKTTGPNVEWQDLDLSDTPMIEEMPVTSAICDPTNGEQPTIVDGHVKLRGYAYSGGGRKIIRVDVTADKGVTWHQARFDRQEATEPPYHWTWTFWSCDVPVSGAKSSVEFWVKAVDSSYQTQPETFKHIWNVRGVACNAYHKVSAASTRKEQKKPNICQK